MKLDFIAKRIKISFPDEKSIDMIEDLIQKSSKTSEGYLFSEDIHFFKVHIFWEGHKNLNDKNWRLLRYKRQIN
jgi:hypothetical protein